MTTNYAIRITRDYNHIKPWLEHITNEDTFIVVYQHDESERTHCHILLKTDYSTDTLKRWYKTILNDNITSTDWSFKTKYKNKDKIHVPVDDNFITYMTKGNLQSVFYQNISHDRLEQYRQQWVEHALEQIKHKEISSYQISKELANWLVQNDMTFNTENHPVDRRQYRDIVDKAISLLNKHQKSYCEFSLKRIITTAFGLSTHKYRYLIIDNLEKNFFR